MESLWLKHFMIQIKKTTYHDELITVYEPL